MHRNLKHAVDLGGGGNIHYTPNIWIKRQWGQSRTADSNLQIGFLGLWVSSMI